MSFQAPPPDWNRVLVQTDQKRMAVGDPTLWANTVVTPIDLAPEGSTPRAFYGEQIILAQTNDRYSRSWSISGKLTISAQTWQEGGKIPNGPFFDGLVPTRLQVFLSILQGIERVTVEHQICLMSGGDPTNIGLCNTQCTTNGGPYLPTYTDTPPTEGSEEGRSFAAIGALIGHTISIRGLFIRGGSEGNQGIIPSATISVLLAPYAGGTGL